MPSYKPKVQILLNEEYHKKFKALCNKERRSDSIMGALMIEKYIDEYEAEHGKIIIEEKEENKRRISPLNPLGAGLTVGDTLGGIVVDKIKQKKD